MEHLFVQTVGNAATNCSAPRATISQSGILLALHQVMLLHRQTIMAAHVEFLQCALLAGQYRFACRMVRDDWPRPQRVTSVEQVLRYYYLRGMIHIGCDEFKVAIRCFWTVLSVPMERVSVIAVEAWKKLVLCQCLVIPEKKVASFQQLVAFPVTASVALVRLLTKTNDAPETTNTTTTTAQEGANNTDAQNINAKVGVGIPAYVEVAKAFATDRNNFLQVKSKYADQWTRDKTTGLMEKLETELLHRHVQKLASIYSVIPFGKLSTELGVPVEELPALLQQVDGLVVTERDDMVTLDHIESEPMPTENLAELMTLTDRIRKLDLAIVSSTRYQNLRQGDSLTGAALGIGRGAPQGVEDF